MKFGILYSCERVVGVFSILFRSGGTERNRCKQTRRVFDGDKLSGRVKQAKTARRIRRYWMIENKK